MMRSRHIKVFEILVREHEDMLVSYLSALTGDRALAEEVAQDAFVTAYKKLNTLKNHESFPAWIRTIGRNLALNALKRRSREVPTDPDLLLGIEEMYATLDSSVQGDTWRERAAIIKACFEKLPPNLKESCSLHYLESAKAKDIAQSLGASLSAVLKRLERAAAKYANVSKSNSAWSPWYDRT